MDGRARYEAQLDTLIALITYMALTRWRSRSPNGLSKDLGLAEDVVTCALNGFPGLFRQSADFYPTDAGPQHSFTLHARYARRRPRGADPALNQPAGAHNTASLSDPEPTQDGAGEELDAETLRALLDYVTERARAERDTRFHTQSIRWLLAAATVAALASLAAAVIQTLQ
ncbi:hypothetical protein ACIRL0_12100 [Streptomyces sp. NPDC102365]|uniref:hypothetical protein n=1 Tax=Streptomyces sp. NPDC102365 TaxID=3366162 RepID=UPI0038114559